MPALLVLFYDDRYNETRDRQSLQVYKSLDREGIPFIVGRPSSNSIGSERRMSRPGDAPAERSLLRYRPGLKINWLVKTLPTLAADFVLVLDTDIIWLCDANEVLAKRDQLLRHLAAAEDAVVLFGEKGMWPPFQEFRGIQLRTNETAGYPRASPDEPFRFVNGGAALGRPRDVHALLHCMAARFEGFPYACPAGHGPDGRMRHYMANQSWVPPPLVVPSRVTKHHGMRLRGSNWGWEQGCFHAYYLEYLAGEHPSACPPVVLDRSARWLLHLAGVPATSLAFSKGKTQPANPSQHAKRVLLRETGQLPCALHANGPSKSALKPLSEWWQPPMSMAPILRSGMLSLNSQSSEFARQEPI